MSSLNVPSAVEMTDKEENTSASQLFSAMDMTRQSLLNRMRLCSRLTLPHVLPPLEHNENNQLPTPFQGMGAKAVNNLASKLQMTMFPPSSPFFKLEVDESLLQEIEAEGGSGEVEKVRKKLREQEMIVKRDMHRSGFRTPLFQAIKHAIITGNYLLHIPEKETPSLFRVDHYVVRRDVAGIPQLIILKQTVTKQSLDDKTLAYVMEKEQASTMPDQDNSAHSAIIKRDDVEIYTRIWLDGEKYRERQELKDGYIIEGSEGTSSKNAPSWIAGRWISITGEDYGRSLVEEYLGDFRSLEALYKSSIKGCAQMAKVVNLVRPSGMTRIKDLATANTGDFVQGNPEDISAFQTDKQADFQVVRSYIQDLESRIAQAFLVTSSLQRDAERVTAEEIRLMAKEIEDSLGGVYSVLADELQVPVIRRQLDKLQKLGKIPDIKDDDVEPKVVGGIEGLGGAQELDKIMRVFSILNTVTQSPELASKLDLETFTRKVCNFAGVDPDGIFKSPEQLAQEQQMAMQQQQQQAMMQGMQQAIPQVAGGMMRNPEAGAQMMQGMQEGIEAQQQ